MSRQDIGGNGQHERLMVLEVVVAVLAAFWFFYAVGWIFSCARERARSRHRLLPL